jgi:hypothetical protein
MQLPIAIVDEGDPKLVVTPALQCNLSAYDATYLRAAMITSNPTAHRVPEPPVGCNIDPV